MWKILHSGIEKIFGRRLPHIVGKGKAQKPSHTKPKLRGYHTDTKAQSGYHTQKLRVAITHENKSSEAIIHRLDNKKLSGCHTDYRKTYTAQRLSHRQQICGSAAVT